jgi:hypothetical protein
MTFDDYRDDEDDEEDHELAADEPPAHPAEPDGVLVRFLVLRSGRVRGLGNVIGEGVVVGHWRLRCLVAVECRPRVVP